MCIYHILHIQSSVDGHVGCFHLLATGNHAAVNTGVPKPSCSHVQHEPEGARRLLGERAGWWPPSRRSEEQQLGTGAWLMGTRSELWPRSQPPPRESAGSSHFNRVSHQWAGRQVRNQSGMKPPAGVWSSAGTSVWVLGYKHPLPHTHTHRLGCSALPHEEILGHWGSKPKNYWRRWSQNWDSKTVSLKTQHECKLNTENVQNRPIHRHRKLIFYYLLPKGRMVSDGKQTQRFFLGWWKCAKLRLWGWLYNSVNILKFTKFDTQNRRILYVNCISIRFLKK